MAFVNAGAPHTHQAPSITKVMLTVILAAIPGLLAQLIYFGWGVLVNLVIATIAALAFESVILKIRRLPVIFFLKDGSAIVTALLLAVSLPPFSPWWLTVAGSLFAIVFVKQLFGGLGHNPFNPAMAAYALLLISFPVPMTTLWSAPLVLQDIGHAGFVQTLAAIFTESSVDGFTMATPLDSYKLSIAEATQAELLIRPEFQQYLLPGWFWVNLGYLVGGVFLIWKRIITWHTPVAMLTSLAVLALMFSWDPDSRVPVQMHLFGGATMLGAFFIATDPASAATSNKGKLFYGAGIGVLVYLIRTWGNYPDAIAFAVLLMNFAAPLIDHYSRPRVYGHQKAVRGYSVTDQEK